MPIPLNPIERLGLVDLNKGPGPMVDLIAALGFNAVVAALKLELFEVLQNRRLSAEALAREVGASPEGISLLLEALEPLGYVAQKDGYYEITAMTASWMLRDAPKSMIGLFQHIEDAVERWKHLSETIRLGKRAPALDNWFDEHKGAWTRYHEGMLSVANVVGDTVVSKIRVPPNARKLLDVGGSHGLYSIKLCRKYPDLEATIMDLAPSKATAEQVIAKHGMSDRVTFVTGDFLKDPVQGTFDVLLLFNFIRIFDRDELIALLRKSAGLLKQNGLLVIVDQFGQKRPSRFAMANHALLRLELYNLTRGRIYTFDETVALATRCGFASPRITSLARAGGLGMVTAVKSK